MANEITVSMALSCANGYFVFPRQGINRQFDQTTPGGASPGTVTVATGGTEIILIDLVSTGWAVFTNLDETNYVTWGGITLTQHNGIMYPGEGAIFRVNPITDTVNNLWMKANTAACDVLVQVLEA